jgi:hypothetical protein
MTYKKEIDMHNKFNEKIDELQDKINNMMEKEDRSDVIGNYCSIIEWLEGLK